MSFFYNIIWENRYIKFSISSLFSLSVLTSNEISQGIEEEGRRGEAEEKEGVLARKTMSEELLKPE